MMKLVTAIIFWRDTFAVSLIKCPWHDRCYDLNLKWECFTVTFIGNIISGGVFYNTDIFIARNILQSIIFFYFLSFLLKKEDNLNHLHLVQYVIVMCLNKKNVFHFYLDISFNLSVKSFKYFFSLKDFINSLKSSSSW